MRVTAPPRRWWAAHTGAVNSVASGTPAHGRGRAQPEETLHNRLLLPSVLPRAARLVPTLVLATVLAGCSSLPSSGPSQKEIEAVAAEPALEAHRAACSRLFAKYRMPTCWVLKPPYAAEPTTPAGVGAG